MLDFLEKGLLLQVPEGDHNSALAVRTFNSASLSIIACMMVGAIGTIFVFERKMSGLATVIFVSLLLVAALWTAHRGKLRQGSMMLVCGLWGAFAVHIWVSGTPNTVFVGPLIAVVGMAGVLLGLRFALIIALVTVALAFALSFLPSVGYTLPSYYPMRPWAASFVLLCTIVLIVPLIDGTVRAFSQASARTREEIETRRKTEEMVRKSEAKYRFLVEHSSDLIWTLDLNLRTTFVTPSVENVLGFTPEERMQQGVEDQLTFESLAYARQKLLEELNIEGEQGIQDAKSALVDLDYYHKNGSIVRLQTAVSFIRDEEGTPIGLHGISRDVTELKRAQEALSEKAELLSEAQRVAKIGNWSHDLQKNELTWSDELYRIFGIEKQEFEGSYELFLSRVHREDRKLVLDINARASREGTSFDFEYRIVLPDGQVKTIREVGYANKDDNGEVISLFGTAQDISDRKKAEEGLRESEAKYRNLVERIPGILYIASLDEASSTTYIGPQIETVLGFSPSEYESDPDLWRKQLHPDDRDRVMTEVVRCRTTGEVFVQEYRALSKQGRIIWLRDEAAFIYDEQGRPLFLQGIMLDVTDRKEAEEALIKNDAQKQAILDGITANVAFVNENLEIRWANKAAAESVGKPPSEMIGHTCHEFWASPERPCEGCPTVRAFKTKKAEHTTMVTPDGRVWDEKGEPVFDSDARLLGVVEIAQDITERKKVEEALKKSEARYRLLFENSPVGIISVDTEGRIMEVNQMLLEALGSPSASATKSINMFELPSLVESGITEAFQSCMKTGDQMLREIPYLSKWGKRSYLRIVLTPLRHDNGTISGCQALVEDITQRRELEDQLRQGQKMEAVGTLAGGIAHDFNNLLHIISGNAELLEMELAEKRMRFVEMTAIRQAATRGADLVKQILTFSRKVETKFESINLNEDVQIIERLLYRTIPKMIEIELRLEEGLPPVRADSTQLEQVLINLAVNAKDAMPDGGRLTIETQSVFLDEAFCRSHTDLRPGRHVVLRISDTGHGMSEDVRQHIFEPFFTTKGLADGTGLGLATVFGIVKMHGGHITCESAIGKGTAFSIYFPAAETADSDVEHEQELQATAVEEGSETILVVDDEELIRDLAKRILEKAGYSVMTASSGREALEVYAQHKSKVALVILDLIMPEMGGKQCLEGLLKIDPQAKVVIASGHSLQGNTKSFLDSEAKAMVSKPFNMRDLLRAVRHVLDGI